jgi:hypothetical protein
VCGMSWRIGIAFLMWTLLIGKLWPMSKNGGLMGCKRGDIRGRPWHLSLCWCLGKLGRKGMWGFSRTNQSHLICSSKRSKRRPLFGASPMLELWVL